MARWIRCLLIALALWLAMTGKVSAQGMVEAGLATAASSTGAAATGKAAGKAIGGIAGSLDKALKSGQQAAGGPSLAKSETPASASAAEPAPAPSWEDPAGIQTGLAYSEMRKRFGPPSLEITGETGKSVTYATKNGAYRIAIEDDKVTAVRKPAN